MKKGKMGIKRGKILLLFVLGIFLMGIVSAVYCCEKTKTGAWCQSVSSESQCDITSVNPVTSEPFKSTNAFCDSTEFCQPGTCIDNTEGTCISSPKSACLGDGGWWDERQRGDIEQCQSGCCLIGDSAAFVTQTRCSVLSDHYGLAINWQGNINDEQVCLLSASPSERGACVVLLIKSNAKTCVMTTRENCQNNIAKNSAYSNVEFHGGYLCSAQAELGTNCIPTEKTICDEQGNVRFIDGCNQPANIYDYRYSPTNPNKNANYLADYWTKITASTCGNGEGNKNSANCGACDYLGGSMCKKKMVGESVSSGDYICKNLDCVNYNHKGEKVSGTNSDYPKHGETWCMTDNITNGYNPGATFFKRMCYNGEVTQVECPVIDSTRQQFCYENVSSNGFRRAVCIVNQWQDCVSQNNSVDCLDANLRDCNWITKNGYYFSANEETKMLSLSNVSGGASNEAGMCVPKFQPGFTREKVKSVEGGASCGLANSVCYVRMSRGAFGGNWECKDGLLEGSSNNCSCVNDKNGNYDGGATWAASMNGICTQMGDCGVKNNYLDKPGYSYPDIIKKLNISKEDA